MKNTFKLFSFLLFSIALFFVACTPKTTESMTKSTTDKIETVKETVVETVNPMLAKKIPDDPDVRMGQLDNGLRYYIRKNTKPEDRAELRLAVNAGSMQEDEDQRGLAHFVEHMAFNGSTNFNKNELVDYLESIGTKFGPDLNAYTSFDETVYMLQIRTDDEDKFMKGLTVIEDWAGGISFDNEEIDKERGVVISEWRTRLSPDQRMQKKTFPVMYHNSRYAERLPIGSPDIIQNADYDTFKRFYKDWYRPDLMAVVAVGDFDMDVVESEIKSRFGKLTNPDNPRKREIYDVPNHKETLISIASDKEAPFTQVRVMYKHPHIKVANINDYRSQLVRNLYNRMLNARLDELKQSASPPFTFSYSGYGSDVGQMDSYYCFAFCPEGGAQRGLQVLLEENKRVLEHGFVASEMERMKTEMLKNAERGVKEKDKTESRRLAMRYVYNYLDENPIPSAEDALAYHQKFLPTITVDEVNSLAKNWITDENRVIVITSPEKENLAIPSEAEVQQILADVEATAVTAYEDQVIDEPLLAKTLSPVAITDEKVLDKIDVTEITLANGVKVVLKSTDFQNDEIQMTATSYGGTSNYSDADYASASNAASVIMEAGLGNFDKTQLEKLLTGKKVNVRPYIGETMEGMRGDASPEDIETMFKMIYLYFTAPRKDETALKSFVSKQGAIYKNLMSNPQYFFMDQTMKIKSNNSIRRGFPTMEKMDAIDLDRAYQIFRERFGDASDFTFFFVGNFDPAQIKELAATYLGNLPTMDADDNWKDLGITYPKGKIEKDMKKGEAPKSFIDMTFHGSFDNTPKNRYIFNSMVQIMRIKMRESMREDKGGVYGVRVSGNVDNIPEDKYSINISFNSDPANTKDLIDTAMKDIAKAKEIGAEQKDIDKVKETQKQSRIKDLKENRFWINQLTESYRRGTDPTKLTVEDLVKASEGLTAEEIKKAASQYFNMDNFIKIVMEPEPAEEN